MTMDLSARDLPDHLFESISSADDHAQQRASRCCEVWVRLPGQAPVEGLALTWCERRGVLGATVTRERAGKVRTEWLPITVLHPRAAEVMTDNEPPPDQQTPDQGSPPGETDRRI
jgi:hypothetical protein